ncbi:MAG: type III pantothenate kinase [Acidobacteriaceae bacterium]|nr:type III pantothenate kinase [Acidobacteriaceae bacterium]
MLLAIDIGNTNAVLGLYQLGSTDPAPEAVASWRITTPREETADEFGIMLNNLFALRGLKLNAVTAVAIASVVPPLNYMLRRASETYLATRPMFIEPGTKTGLTMRVDNPTDVGADRIVNCVAALAQYGGPAIVVDMGTATTFDVVSKQGEFLGGAIAPGLEISANALFARAARLPRVDIRRPARVIGTNTVDHMQIGLYYGYIGLVDGILEHMIAELGPETKTVATGGLAKLIAGGSKYIAKVDEMLTLNGLRLLYERNRP